MWYNSCMATATSPPPAPITPPTETPEPPAPVIGARFAAFRYRDYRLYWFGSFLSLIGSQMSSVAIGWQIYQLTHNPLMLGLVGLFTVVPLVLFSLYGGVIADTVDRRKLLLGCQVVLMLTSATLALTTLTGVIVVGVFFATAAVQGAVTAFANPTRSALIPALVPRADLPNAISLSVTSWQIAAVIGPALGGLIIGAATRAFGTDGVGTVYVVDAVSFLAVVASLLLMHTRTAPAEVRDVSLSAAMTGLRFVFGHPIMRGTMLLDFFATFFGASMSLMPIFATDILHVGAEGLGFLLAAPSIGAVVTALVITGLPTIHRQGAAVLWGVAAYGVAWVVFGLTNNYWLALLALAGTGAADTVSMVMRQTIRQLATPDELRGRMTSVNMIFFMGGPQLGEMEGSIIAKYATAPWAAITGGLGVLIVTALVALRSTAVRDYRVD